MMMITLLLLIHPQLYPDNRIFLSGGKFGIEVIECAFKVAVGRVGDDDILAAEIFFKSLGCRLAVLLGGFVVVQQVKIGQVIAAKQNNVMRFQDLLPAGFLA